MKKLQTLFAVALLGGAAANAQTQADALSTACFVLGEQEGTALIESLGETQALFIRRDGTMAATAGFPWDGA